jgi:hypothetical protein
VEENIILFIDTVRHARVAEVTTVSLPVLALVDQSVTIEATVLVVDIVRLAEPDHPTSRIP